MRRSGSAHTAGRWRLASVITLLLAVPAAAQSPAPPDDPAALRARIEQLERELAAVRQQVAATTAAAAGSTAASSLGSAPGATATNGGAEPAPATAAATAAEEIERLDQRIRVIARQLELEKERAAEAAKTAPATVVGSSGFALRSGDGGFQLRLRGLIHTDGRFFLDDSADTSVDTFLLRRVRPTVDGTLFKFVQFRLNPDFGDGRTVLQDAYIDFDFHSAARLRVGKTKEPFGIERLMSASEMPFMERALPTTVAPNRDIGIMLQGDLLGGRLSYSGGVFNGVIDGGSIDADDRDGKDVVGRVMVHPFRRSKNERLTGLGFGVAASHGSQRGTATAPGLASYRTIGQVYFRFRQDGTEAGTVIADGTRNRWSAQGYYYAGRLGVLAEQVFASHEVRRGNVAATLGVQAFAVTTSWSLTGEPAGYRGLSPRRGFDVSRGSLGAFELVGRYSQLTVDDDAFPVFANPAAASRAAHAWTGGLNWYLNRGVKVVVNYDHVRFDGGTASGDRPSEHLVGTRFQVAF